MFFDTVEVFLLEYICNSPVSELHGAQSAYTASPYATSLTARAFMSNIDVPVSFKESLRKGLQLWQNFIKIHFKSLLFLQSPSLSPPKYLSFSFSRQAGFRSFHNSPYILHLSMLHQQNKHYTVKSWDQVSWSLPPEGRRLCKEVSWYLFPFVVSW